MSVVPAISERILAVIEAQLPWALGLCIVFSLLSLLSSHACNPDRPWWKNRGLITDAHYFFLVPIVLPYLRVSLLIMMMTLVWGRLSDDEMSDFLEHGRGPLSQLPAVLQGLLYLILVDLISYWLHRVFHGGRLWPFHAVHHSAVDVDWTTSYRTHPVDSLLRSGFAMAIVLSIGVSPAVAIALVPFDIVSAAFVHANLNWSLGPLKYIIATPVFHRWHHSSPAEGGDMNFASTFSIWDVLFGTFYMPEGRLPAEYGIDEPAFPTDFLGQLIFPFKQVRARFKASRKTA